MSAEPITVESLDAARAALTATQRRPSTVRFVACWAVAATGFALLGFGLMIAVAGEPDARPVPLTIEAP